MATKRRSSFDTKAFLAKVGEGRSIDRYRKARGCRTRIGRARPIPTRRSELRSASLLTYEIVRIKPMQAIKIGRIVVARRMQPNAERL